METTDWLEVGVEENAIDYLERAAEFIQWPDDYKWKWVCISLHGALYAFAICAVRGTDPDRVTYCPNKGKRVRKLIGFQEALKRCQGEEWQYQDSKCLRLSKNEEEAVRAIGETFRNNFVHLKPQSWWIRKSVVRSVIVPSLRVIRFLAIESGNVRFFERQRRARVAKALKILQESAVEGPSV